MNSISIPRPVRTATIGPRLLGAEITPHQTVRLLSPRIAEEIASAAVQAEERLTEREQACEATGTALTALLGQLDAHAASLPLCCWGRECWPFRCLRIRVGHADRRYAATIQALRDVGRR